MKLSLLKEMVEQVQCPGCVVGMDTKCGKFKSVEGQPWSSCETHVMGTSAFGMVGGRHLLIGAPKGFCRMGENTTTIRLFEDVKDAQYDKLNVPVWAMRDEGLLWVRAYSPRVNALTLDVYKKGDVQDLKSMFSEALKRSGMEMPIDVKEFKKDID
jgi:hypothetical protein